MRGLLGSTMRLAVPALVALVLFVLAARVAATLSSLPSPTDASREVTGVPNAVGRPLVQAQALMGKAGLIGVAYERDPQQPDSLVIAQEPPAGSTALRGGIVGFRTRAP